MQEITKPGGIPCGIEGVEPKKEKKNPISLSSLELPNSYGSGFRRLNWERRVKPSLYTNTCKKKADRKLSTDDIMSVAGDMFIWSSHLNLDDCFTLNHLFDLSSAGLSDEEVKDVKLAQLLLVSAEKVGYPQYDRASMLLNQCHKMSSNTRNPVQSVVYYFSQPLQGKIDLETGRITSKGSAKEQALDIYEAWWHAMRNTLFPVTQFARSQAILENVAEAKKVHIIDLSILNGVQWTAFIEALASRNQCPLELLRITAIGSISKYLIEDTGKRLINEFARSMGLPFSFKIVMVSDMLDCKEDLFKLDVEEQVAIYAHYILKSMITTPNRLEHLMRVLRNINSCVMVMTETEANHNSPIFGNRFIEALFFYSAYLDCLEDCMRRDDQHRMITESVFVREGINKMIAEEGEKRKNRHVKIDVWRAFFARYGLLEAELSMSSL